MLLIATKCSQIWNILSYYFEWLQTNDSQQLHLKCFQTFNYLLCKKQHFYSPKRNKHNKISIIFISPVEISVWCHFSQKETLGSHWQWLKACNVRNYHGFVTASPLFTCVCELVWISNLVMEIKSVNKERKPSFEFHTDTLLINIWLSSLRIQLLQNVS